MTLVPPYADGAPRAEARRGQPAGHRAEQGAGGIGADEQARLALREPELVRVVRQERHERRVEHRVRERDRADEEEEPAHGADDTAGPEAVRPPGAARYDRRVSGS